MFKKLMLPLLAAVAMVAAMPAVVAAAPPDVDGFVDQPATQESPMSYSFQVKAATKAEALQAAAAQFDQVCSTQPIHERDRAAALETAAAMAELLTVPEGKDLSLSVSGWVSWQGVDTQHLTAASVTVSVGLADRPT